MTLKIALLGAESTGKTQLTANLASHLRGQGHHVAVVHEYLREWCESAGRTPRPEEQMGIATEQERRVDEAANPTNGAGQPDIVIADTTALMVAIYSAMLFEDGTLYRFALQRQRGYDLTLVTGLDLPWVADGLQREGPHVREPVDTLVRAGLAKAGVSYRVIYGDGPARLEHALDALHSVLPDERRLRAREDASAKTRGGQAWTWVCEKCGDAACEHRLFTGLLASKAAGRWPR
jgi:nicotinamide riboside kinase